MSLAKQPSVSTKQYQPAPKGNGKRSYQKAVKKALQEGSAQYRGKQMSLQELGGTPAPTREKVPAKRLKPSAFLTQQQVSYLSWNAGSLTTAVWEELLSLLNTPAYSSVKIVTIQETHWRGTWQFTKGPWNVVSSGTTAASGAGVLVMVHTTLCRQHALRFNEVLPGRLLQVRVPGDHFSLDIVCCYQHVWRAKETLETNRSLRSTLIRSLRQTIQHVPQRNSLLITGDFNMSLKTDMRHVGPCVPNTCRLGHRGSKELQQLLEDLGLVAANTWGSEDQPLTCRGIPFRR